MKWIVLLMLLVGGCSSPIAGMATAGSVVTQAHLSAGGQLDAARDKALDEVEAQLPAGPERNAELDRVAAEWQPVGEALDDLKGAIEVYAQSVTLAHAAGTGEEILPQLVALLARVVLLYDTVVDLARALGEELPHLPEMVRALARSVGGVQ
jgi:hypothetical protein